MNSSDKKRRLIIGRILALCMLSICAAGIYEIVARLAFHI